MTKPDCNTLIARKANDIWSAATNCRIQAYKFIIGPAAKRTLLELVGVNECNQVFRDNCPACVNRRLRKAITPILKSDTRTEQLLNVSRWIIREWGQIRRGTEAIDGWVDRLGNFSEEEMNKFAREMGSTRIASWSKLLAFADPKRHAIYDARVAASLNCSLVEIVSECWFYQPPSQNLVIKPLYPVFRPHTYGYFE
jgi:hypothetical protein